MRSPDRMPNLAPMTPTLSPQAGRGRSVRAGRESKPGVRVKALLLDLAGVLDGIEGLELDIVKLAADLLDLSQIDVLDDVAGLRIYRNRAARALPRHALHRRNEGVAVGVAAGLLERLVDEMHAVI